MELTLPVPAGRIAAVAAPGKLLENRPNLFGGSKAKSSMRIQEPQLLCCA